MAQCPSITIQLIHIHGPLKGTIQEFSDGYVSIGRHPSSSVRFSSDFTAVSRNHAEIIREGNQFKLVDHSTNGTYLNGRKVTEAYLKDGDVLEFSEGGPKVSFITTGSAPDQPKAVDTLQYEDLEVVREEVVLDRPAQVRRSDPEKSDEASPQAPVDSQSSPSIPVWPQKPAQPSPEELPTGKVNAPLVIQFGPSLRSYRELPVTIGSSPGCDFVIIHPGILGQHAQIIFARGLYWIKDLTGQGKIRVNNGPIYFQAPLNVNDLISLAPQGPALSFLGEGRFAEAAESVEAAPAEPD
ncbi:MAG: FHA domain-containing protein, partial [Deltaproteobacteria bacterium]|nr:FHA domain-containing protein [Deltaproteobacteria bacterium]